jgi:hypothetical protein
MLSTSIASSLSTGAFNSMQTALERQGAGYLGGKLSRDIASTAALYRSEIQNPLQASAVAKAGALLRRTMQVTSLPLLSLFLNVALYLSLWQLAISSSSKYKRWQRDNDLDVCQLRQTRSSVRNLMPWLQGPPSCKNQQALNLLSPTLNPRQRRCSRALLLQKYLLVQKYKY